MDSRERAQLLEALSDGVYAVDRDRRITYWNAAATRITGYTAEEALGRFCGDGLLNHVDDTGAALCGWRCPLKATIGDGQRREVHVYLHHKDGHVAPVRVAAAALRDEAGAVVGAVETFSEDLDGDAMTKRLQLAEELALLDALTGIGNRRYFERSLHRRWADWVRDGRRFGVVMVDLDRFKEVNDLHGHDVGDTVLQVAARSLHGAVRADDEVCRFGGDEFAVVTAQATTAELAALVQRLHMVIAQSRFSGAADEPLDLTASVGAALVLDGEDAASLVRRADQRLLQAKHEGRNRTVVLAD